MTETFHHQDQAIVPVTELEVVANRSQEWIDFRRTQRSVHLPIHHRHIDYSHDVAVALQEVDANWPKSS